MTADEMRAAYEEGATIEEISLETGIDTRKVRKMIREAGGEMRPAKMRPGTVMNKPTREPKTERPTGVHSAPRGAMSNRKGGHRRRGQF